MKAKQLPACPNVKGAAQRAAEMRATIRVPVYGCVKKKLSIKVHFKYVKPSSNTPQKAIDDAWKRAEHNVSHDHLESSPPRVQEKNSN